MFSLKPYWSSGISLCFLTKRSSIERNTFYILFLRIDRVTTLTCNLLVLGSDQSPVKDWVLSDSCSLLKDKKKKVCTPPPHVSREMFVPPPHLQPWTRRGSKGLMNDRICSCAFRYQTEVSKSALSLIKQNCISSLMAEWDCQCGAEKVL